jgi:hypothetical protein
LNSIAAWLLRLALAARANSVLTWGAMFLVNVSIITIRDDVLI